MKRPMGKYADSNSAEAEGMQEHLIQVNRVNINLPTSKRRRNIFNVIRVVCIAALPYFVYNLLFMSN